MREGDRQSCRCEERLLTPKALCYCERESLSLGFSNGYHCLIVGKDKGLESLHRVNFRLIFGFSFNK